MALIVCTECGKNFSEKAAACPDCGCPVSAIKGEGNTSDAGQLAVATIAFDDGRYDEAYQFLTALYSQNDSNVHILVKLALATGAREYFANGIPNSTKDLFTKALTLIKTKATSQDDVVAELLLVAKDTKKVIDNMRTSVVDEISSALDQTTTMRSTGSMVADTLFAPTASAHRNLYEDRRTLESNTKILKNAIANKNKVTAILDEFCSFVLKSIADVIVSPIESNSELYSILAEFVINAEDSKIYEKLSDGKTPQGNVSGLCFGAEKVILDFEETACYLRVNGVQQARGFTSPKGKLVLTNYKVEYQATKDKWSFNKSLDTLVSVDIMGPDGSSSGLLAVFIGLTFSDGTTIIISPVPTGMQAIYVKQVRDELKLSNR